MCQSVVGRVLVLMLVAAAFAAPAAQAAEQPLISAPADAFVGEGDGSIDLVVRLATASTDTVTVNYTTPEITADGGTFCNYDYAPVSGTLTFAPGETSKPVHVTILNCAGAEPSKSFGLSLATPVNGVIARAKSRVTIIDNDTLAASPRIEVRDATVDEKDGFAFVPVILAQASNSAVSVNYAMQDGTAAGTDYTPQAGTLTFAAGQVVKTLAIPIADDAADEPAESFTVNLSNPANATVVGPTGTVTIGASDGTPTTLPAISTAQDAVVGEADGYVNLVVRLSAPGTQLVTVKYVTPEANADAGSFCNYDYVYDQGTLTFAPGETTKVIDVELLDCAGAASDSGMLAFLLSLDTPINSTIQRAVQRIEIVTNNTLAASPRIYAKDATVDEKDGQALIPVILGQQSNSVVTVDYATASGTAGTADYTPRTGTLTFAPGQTAKTVAIPVADDSATEPAERFTLNLANAANATIANGTGTATIGANDRTPTTLPAISTAQDAVVGEGDGYVDLAVRLSAPGTEPVSVSFATAEWTADAGSFCNYNYISNQGAITFAPGETTKLVRVDLLDCAGGGTGPLSFVLNLSGPTNATIQRASQRVEIVGNDTLSATPRIYVKNAFVDEKDGDALVTVALVQASNSTITADYATQDGTATGADYAPQSGTLTFAPGQTARTITIPIADDAAAEPFETFSLHLANAINATIASSTATVFIGASDGTASNVPTLSAAPDQIVGEGDWYVDLAVRLSAPGTQPVSVHYATPEATADAGSFCNYNYVPGSGTLTFAPGETTKIVRVDVLDCSPSETLKSFELNLDTPINATIARDSQYVSIVDNDNLVPVPSLVVRDAIVDEKDGLALVPVMLGGPRGQVSNSTITVDYTTGGGTAGAGDYTPLTGTLTFAPGQTVQTLAVPIADDLLNEPAETFAVNLSNPLNATIETGTGTVVIGASDAAASALPALSAPPDVIVGEASGYADLVVRLAAPASLPVTVHYTMPEGTADAGGFCGYDYLPRTDTLTFAPGETTKVVRAELLDCSPDQLLVYFSLALNTPGNATLARPSGRVFIAGPIALTGLTVTPANPTLAIGATRQFTVTGQFADSSTRDLTSTAVWSSSASGVATITAAGVAKAVAGGATTISATIAGVGDTTTLTVPVPDSITFVAPVNHTYGDADFALGATASTGLAVSYRTSGPCTVTGATLHITGAGTCTVTASQGSLPEVARSFTIAKATQAIAFAELTDRTEGDADVGLSASASSGLPVSFSASGACSLSGASVRLTGAGTCTVTASQPGNGNYAAATSVAHSFTIRAKPVATTIPTVTPTVTPKPTPTVTPTPTPRPKVRCTVPNVIGKTLAAAKKALTKAHCAAGKITRGFSGKVKKDKVVSQSRVPKKVLPGGTAVNLVVSRGRRR